MEDADETRISALMFGRACRLPLARWILAHPKGRFFQSEPPPSVGAPTAVRQELHRMVQLGLLERERPDGENRVYYVRTTADLWRVFLAAVELTSP